MTSMEVEQARTGMNDEYRRTLGTLLTHAERDLRLARAEGDGNSAAKARAWLDTLRAALEIYASSHFVAHGERPWPQETRT